MVDVAKVSMFGIPVGIFNWDDRYGVARFEYDQSFIGRGLEPSPLMMPVREGRVFSFAIWAGTPFRAYLVCWRILCQTLMDVPCSTDGCL